MNAQTKVPAPDTATDLAAKIYVELVCRNVVVTEGAAQIKANPENLAKISFKLADVLACGGGSEGKQRAKESDVRHAGRRSVHLERCEALTRPCSRV